MRNFWLMVTVILFSINSNVFASGITWEAIGFDVDKLNELLYDKDRKTYCTNISDNGLTMPEDKCETHRKTYVKLGCYPQEFADFTKTHHKVVMCAGAGPFIMAVCGCGCFPFDTKLLVFNRKTLKTEWVEIGILYQNQENYGVFHIATTTNHIEAPELAISYNNEYTVGYDVEKTLYTFDLETGKRLSVTKNHAMLKANGQIVPAKSLTENDALIDTHGKRVEINQITVKTEKMDIYNITLKDVPDQHPIGHLIFAEGLVVGDNVYQSGILEDILGEFLFIEGQKNPKDFFKGTPFAIQDEKTETPLTCRMKVKSSQESIRLEVTLSNPTAQAITFDGTLTPFDSVPNQMLMVLDEMGQPLPYNGILATRKAIYQPVTLEPGQSKTALIEELEKRFHLEVGHRYQMRLMRDNLPAQCGSVNNILYN